MRFDSTEYLTQWVKRGLFPKIHDQIFNAILESARFSTYLDLGCCFGLLGQRVWQHVDDAEVWGVDCDSRAIREGREAGVRIAMWDLQVGRDTMPDLLRMVERMGIRVLIARRILPELFGCDLDLGREFAAGMRKAGIMDVFVQGRVDTSAHSNALYCVEREVDLFAGQFAKVYQRGQVAYLRSA